MSYFTELDGDAWVVDTNDADEYLASGLTKQQAMKLLHFLNGGSLVEWSELYAILSDSGNLE